jgi:hypothetical protein
LRRLIGSPFALVEVIDDGTEAAELESILKQTEERLREHDRKAASDVLSPSSTMSH